MAENEIKTIRPHPGFQERFVRSNVDVVFGGGILGGGKEQPLDAKILTPSGWSTMGDMYVGANVMTPWNGVTTVTGVYPQGIKDCYRIEFFDGRVCEAGLEHLWMVRDTKQFAIHAKCKERYCSFSVLTTKSLIDNMKLGEEYYIPLPDFPECKSDSDHICIKSIEYIGKKQCQCIMVEDKDHLYVTNDFITTHNTFGAILATAEPSLDPNFRACFTRRTFSELKSGGGVVDDVETCFKNYASVKKTEPPRAVFPSGAFIDFRQINDENPAKVKEIWKGAQYDFIYMDELTSYEFSTFKYLMTRNRGKGKWTGKFRGTTNPERDSWVRKFIDWYIDSDGFIRPDKDGVVRYFYMAGNEEDGVDGVVWGDTKEEVYRKCKADIDRKLRSIGGDIKYENLIKSFTFYLGHLSENKSLLEGNTDYIGSVAAVGGRQAQQLLEGNWNVSTREAVQQPIPFSMAEAVFNADPRENNDLWITADLADTGTDNTIIFVWNGLHLFDYAILCTSTPRVNAEKLLVMAEKHDIPNSHIIYDGVRATYINDYIPEAIPFISYRRAMGKYGRMYYNLKDECYARLANVIKRNNLSFSNRVANALYAHQRIKSNITIKNEFVEECDVVMFKELPGGKQTLYNKKEMNMKLGKGRSMDVLDPIAMRMLPLLKYEYGQELLMTAKEDNSEKTYKGQDVYDDSFWC